MIAQSLLLIALVTASAALAQTAPAETYYLKDKEPRTGSMIRDTIGWTDGIPLDKAYDQLTIEQRARLRRAYERMPDDDEPPYPEGGLAAIVRPLSRIAGLPSMQGEVVMHVAVDAKGVAQEFKFIRVPNSEIARAVALIVSATRFRPAKCDGQPCQQEFPLHLSLRRW